MIKSKSFLTGITGASIFILTTIIAGLLNVNYNSISQFISELYAVEAPNADFLRFVCYVPSGILLFLFSIFAIRENNKSTVTTLGFIGVGIGYGLGTVVCSFFNCDAGCNPNFINPSLSQIIHNLTGFLTYLIVPFSILLVAIGSKKWRNSSTYTNLSFLLAIVSFAFFMILNANLDSPYKGLIQRIIEGSILLWIIMTSIHTLKQQNATIK